ncbi:MAG: hypothetical protein MJK10_01950 [Pseudomonadales bacterium]|nr:hypothetical protein [Pseudomonadales bacterium]NRA14631.1 hypothetical protein [Oceanospirillaceae bacterium]
MLRNAFLSSNTAQILLLNQLTASLKPQTKKTLNSEDFRVYAEINELTNTIAKQWLADVLIAESIANQSTFFNRIGCSTLPMPLLIFTKVSLLLKRHGILSGNLHLTLEATFALPDKTIKLIMQIKKHPQVFLIELIAA